MIRPRTTNRLRVSNVLDPSPAGGRSTEVAKLQPDGASMSTESVGRQLDTVSSLPFLTDSTDGASPEFLAELAAHSQQLETASPRDIIAWAVEHYFPQLTMATAFGPEGCVILHFLGEIEPRTHVFNLDTGYQFAETLELRERIARRYGIEVEMRRPELTVEQYEQLHGGPLYTTNPDQCCFDRKVKVLRQSTAGMRAWMSGIRRDQSTDRAKAPIVGWDKKFNLVKISPLANWTKQDVWGLIVKEDIPYNPLHDQGFPSIGCWPCTRRVVAGEDERAGRWSGTAKTECGLHTSDERDGSGI